jgi:hypothetical protein
MSWTECGLLSQQANASALVSSSGTHTQQTVAVSTQQDQEAREDFAKWVMKVQADFILLQCDMCYD